jgi:hypothetical protein
MGLAGHCLVALHLKQGPRLSNKWGPPHDSVATASIRAEDFLLYVFREEIVFGSLSGRIDLLSESSCITKTMPFAELADEVGQASAFVPPGIVQRGGDGCSVLC